MAGRGEAEEAVLASVTGWGWFLSAHLSKPLKMTAMEAILEAVGAQLASHDVAKRGWKALRRLVCS